MMKYITKYSFFALIVILVSCNGEIEDKSKDVSIDRTNKSEISQEEIKEMRDSLIGVWRVKKVMFYEKGYSKKKGTARVRNISQIYCGKNVDSLTIEFLDDDKVSINKSHFGQWIINSQGKLVLTGDLYVKDTPIFTEVPLFIGEDNFYTYLTADFNSAMKGIRHQVVYCLSR